MTGHTNTEMEILLQSTSMDDVYPALRRSLETLRGAKFSVNDFANMMTNWRRFQSRMLAFMRDEDVALAVALRLESAFGGWKPPAIFE